MLRFPAMVPIAVTLVLLCWPAWGVQVEVAVESKTIVNDPILPADGFVDVFLNVAEGGGGGTRPRRLACGR